MAGDPINARNLILMGVLFASTGALAEGAVARLLARNPSTEAERAFASGDKRHIVVPVCDGQNGEVLPGWPLHESPEAIAAIDNGIRPVTCADFASSSGAFRSVARYAENYNRRMLELTKKQAK
jgi:hypothetical protein